MKNYLLFPDCFTADSINRCRFAILKFLGSYNLTPPTNISVIIYTNKAAAFEIFLPFFNEIKIISGPNHFNWDDNNGLKKLLTGYDGNILVCRSNAYFKQPVEDLYTKMHEGDLLYGLHQDALDKPIAADNFIQKALVIGINTSFMQSLSSPFSASAKNIQGHFVRYKKRKSINTLLKLFFDKNDEESTTNLVKSARSLDIEALENEAAAIDKLPFFQKWFQRLAGKNPVLQHYQNKL